MVTGPTFRIKGTHKLIELTVMSPHHIIGNTSIQGNCQKRYLEISISKAGNNNFDRKGILVSGGGKGI